MIHSAPCSHLAPLPRSAPLSPASTPGRDLKDNTHALYHVLSTAASAPLPQTQSSIHGPDGSLQAFPALQEHSWHSMSHSRTSFCVW